MSSQPVFLPQALAILATTIGALTGALHATRKGMGLLGILAIAVCTGLGGGAIRDTILATGTTAFLLNPQYLACAAFAAVIGYFFARAAARLKPAYVLLDALMIGFWVLLGCTHAEAIGLGVISVIFVGVVSATGGGLLRDVLCNDVPSAVQRGVWYSPAALVAALVWVGLEPWDAVGVLSEIAALLAATATRLLSMKFGLKTPLPMDVSSRVLRMLRLSPR